MPRKDTLVAVGAAAAAARLVRKDLVSKMTAAVGTAALRRGMHSGNRGWYYVAAGATGIRLAQRYLGRKEDVLRIKLRPGESIQINEIVRTK
jgi:hypothetical protein